MAEKQIFSVQRGLMELKTLGARIDRAARKPFVSHYVGDEGVPQGYKSVEEFEKSAKGSYESVNALIARRNAIKAAIIASNAVTQVEVGGVKMTVAAAIDRKDSIEFEKLVLQQLKGQFAHTTRAINGENQLMEQRIAKRIDDESGKDKKIEESYEKQIVDATKSRYEPHIVDPIGIREEIERLEKSIEDFELNVDVALSEINARTEIEITL